MSGRILADVAAGGAADAGGLDVELLGDFLDVVTAAVVAGRPMTARQLRAYRSIGDTAAQQGVALRALLDLYLSAAWRLWRHLPPVVNAHADPAAVVVAGEVMLHAVDDAVAALAQGFQLAQRSLVRAQESARREFVDDLLSGAADIAGVLRRAAGFGLDLSGPYAVAVVAAQRPFDETTPLVGALERAVQGSKGDAPPLVATKEGRLVVVFAAPGRAAITHVAEQLGSTLGPASGDRGTAERPRRSTVGSWRIGLGRPGVGADGVLVAYREACDALVLAGRLGLDRPVVEARDLLAYQVLLRDRVALTDLIGNTLGPLTAARGGAGPLLDTLAAYFDSGSNTAQTARSLHLSVRAVTYRLERVQRLTGHDPSAAAERFMLQIAVLGAKLLDWPATPLS